METRVSWDARVGKDGATVSERQCAEAIAIAPFVGARNGVNARRAFRQRAHARYNARMTASPLGNHRQPPPPPPRRHSESTPEDGDR